jgi:hypothetical protein
VSTGKVPPHITSIFHIPQELKFLDTTVTPSKVVAYLIFFMSVLGELLHANLAADGKVYVILGDKLG